MPSQDLAATFVPTPTEQSTPRRTVIWNEERDRIIIENRGRMSASLIAEMIGDGCTRLAVIGRARRLGLERLSRHDPVRSTRPRAARPCTTAIHPLSSEIPDVPPAVDTLIPFEQRKTLLTLGPRDCRWPVGDPQAEDFFFCGAERSGMKSYCAAHCHRAIEPPLPRDPAAAKNGTRNFHLLPVRVFGPGAAPADRWLRDSAA